MSLMVSVSGVRGLIKGELTDQVVRDYARAWSTHVDGGTIVIGRDSRPSGTRLSQAAIDGLTTSGSPVIDVGIATTPATALMVVHHGAAGGMVITASHNPAEYNGLKLLTARGTAPPAEIARRVWSIHDAGRFRQAPSRSPVRRDDSAAERHVNAVVNYADPQPVIRRHFRVVVDSINGAGCASARLLLHRLGCTVVHLNDQPTGRFVHQPEPLAQNLTALCQAVRSHGADLGFAQDPDADRLAVVDEGGRYIGEEFTLALAADWLFRHRPGPAATNLSTSRMIDDLARRTPAPCTVHRTAVGEANVVQTMEAVGCTFGGEGNGGVIVPAVVGVRDSLVGMAVILQLIAERDQPLSAVVASMPAYSMIKHKMPCSPDRIPAVLQEIRRAVGDRPINDLDGLRIDWPEGWVHVRGSNTEPLLRIIAEAADHRTAEDLARRIQTIAEPIVSH